MFSSPVKCIPSVTKTSLFLHFVGFTIYLFGTVYDRLHHHFPAFDRYGGRFQFLTYINVYVTLISSGVAFMVDLIEISSDQPPPHTDDETEQPSTISRLIAVRDELISCWVFLGCTIVPILYWGLIVFDYDGIHNEEIEKQTPLFGWFNQFTHTLPMFYTIVLITFVNYDFCSSKKVLLNSSIFTVCYVSWMGYCAQMNGFWAYPVLQNQTTLEFVIFLGLCVGIMMALLLGVRKVSSLIWSESRRNRSTTKKSE